MNGTEPKVFMVTYAPSASCENAVRGAKDGLRDAGLVAERDYNLEIVGAEDEMARLPGLLEEAKAKQPDLLITFSTPTLQAAAKAFHDTPIVFAFTGSAITAGVARSDREHQPNVTGVPTPRDFEEMPATIKEVLPNVKRVGTVFCPVEANAVFDKSRLAEMMQRAGIEFIAIPAAGPEEFPQALASLCDHELDAIVSISDNLSMLLFPAMVEAAERHGLPIFAFAAAQETGAVVTLECDYYEAGREAGLLAARVLRGEDPADLPITPFVKTRLVVDLDQARKVGLELPPSLLSRADDVIP